MISQGAGMVYRVVSKTTGPKGREGPTPSLGTHQIRGLTLLIHC